MRPLSLLLEILIIGMIPSAFFLAQNMAESGVLFQNHTSGIV